MIKSKTITGLLLLLLVSYGCKSSGRSTGLPTPPTVSTPVSANDTMRSVVEDKKTDQQPAILPDSIQGAADLFRKQLQRGGVDNVFIGTAADFGRAGSILLLTRSGLTGQLQSLSRPLEKMNPEAYLIDANGKQVIIIGNSAAALRHAVYDYLEQLGFRFFQPGAEWQIVPRLRNIQLVYKKLTQPAFHTRVLANGHGFLKNEALALRFNEWAEANRMGGFFEVNIGHSYQLIVANNKKQFQEHPEYFATSVKKGEIPPTPKFNVTNPALVNLVKEDAISRIKESIRIGRPLKMLSMEPSDGSGFCDNPGCMKLGGISDQVFYLANEVAKYVKKSYPDIWVGSLAYNEHILPTKIPLEKNVFVMVTNGFNRSKFNTNELLQQWSRLASRVGVYDYLSVYEWDYDLPGKSNASQIAYLRKAIPAFYQSGATSYLAETNIGWISKGLGQYITGKLLWDLNANVDSLKNDYFNQCFGNVSAQLKKLYASWESAPKGFISDNLLGDWINMVLEADRQNKDEAVARRLDHIKIYLHYLALYKRLKAAPTPQLMTEMLVLANRTMTISAFSTVAVMASLPKYVGFPQMSYYANPQQAWTRETTPVSRTEINQWLSQDFKGLTRAEGLRSYAEMDQFKNATVAASSPAAAIKAPAVTFTGTTRFLVRIDKQSAGNLIELTSGLSAKVNPGVPVVVKVFDYKLFRQIKTEADVVLLHEQHKMGIKEQFSLASLKAGDYVIEVDDSQRAFNIRITGQLHFNVMISPDLVMQTSSVKGLNNFIVRVPPGTKTMVVNKTKSLRIQTPTGRILSFSDNKTSSIVVEVKAGEEGDWLFFYQVGILGIDGVPPYLGMDPTRFLAPVEP
ncbi:MAG: DUF4838 domain-containing protein [Chitinophagaceae bacterium]